MILFLKIFAFWAFTTIYVALVNCKIHPYILKFFEGTFIWEEFTSIIESLGLDLSLEFSIVYTMVYGLLLLTIYNLVTT